jgi:hypothetical protein
MSQYTPVITHAAANTTVYACHRNDDAATVASSRTSAPLIESIAIVMNES